MQVAYWYGAGFDASEMLRLETIMMELLRKEARPDGCLPGAAVLNETNVGGQGIKQGAKAYTLYVLLGDLGPADKVRVTPVWVAARRAVRSAPRASPLRAGGEQLQQPRPRGQGGAVARRADSIAARPYPTHQGASSPSLCAGRGRRRCLWPQGRRCGRLERRL